MLQDASNYGEAAGRVGSSCFVVLFLKKAMKKSGNLLYICYMWYVLWLLYVTPEEAAFWLPGLGGGVFLWEILWLFLFVFLSFFGGGGITISSPYLWMGENEVSFTKFMVGVFQSLRLNLFLEEGGSLCISKTELYFWREGERVQA